MRTTNVDVFNITYPEEIVWKNDSNVVKVTSANNQAGAQVTVEDPAGNSHTLEYHSDLNSIMFYLDDAIRALYSDNIGVWRCRVSCYDQGIPLAEFSFTFYVLNGKSFITRSHGVSSVIYVYNSEELYKLQIYSPQQGVATCGQFGFNVYTGLNQYNLTGAIRHDGEYQLCLRDSNTVPPIANVVIDTPVSPYKSVITWQAIINQAEETTGGDVFNQNKVIFPICHKIIFQDHCDDYNFGEVAYTDLDGMRRYLGGKIIEDNDEVTSESYINSSPEIYKTNPNRFITKHEKTVKLALTDIEKEAYPNDIMYSESVYYRCWDGELRNCSIKNKSITRKDDEYVDIELEIIVSQ